LKKEDQLQGEVNERKRFIGSKEEEDSSATDEAKEEGSSTANEVEERRFVG
jgi:hypothetical protein